MAHNRVLHQELEHGETGAPFHRERTGSYWVSDAYRGHTWAVSKGFTLPLPLLYLCYTHGTHHVPKQTTDLRHTELV